MSKLKKQLTHVIKPRAVSVKSNKPNDAGDCKTITIHNGAITIQEAGNPVIEETGGPIDVNWDKRWAGNTDTALEGIYNKPTKIAAYLDRERNTHTNMIMKTQQQIADILKISAKTVSRVIRILEKNNYIRKRPGYIMINPDCSWRGSAKERMNALKIYYEDLGNMPTP